MALFNFEVTNLDYTDRSLSIRNIKKKIKEQSFITWSDHGKNQIQSKTLRYQKSMPKGRLGNPRRTHNCSGSKFDSEVSDRAPSQRPQNKGITLRTSSDVKTISNFGLYNLEEI